MMLSGCSVRRRRNKSQAWSDEIPPAGERWEDGINDRADRKKALVLAAVELLTLAKNCKRW
jgi:hypothetical protein